MGMRWTLLAALALVAALVFPVAGCSSSGSGSDPEAPSNGAASSGEDLTRSKCGGSCHGFDRVEPVKKGRAQWADTVERMEGYGLEITDDERDMIVDYLAENHS